jgi:acetyltransferase
VAAWKLKQDGQITIRPIRPEDEPLMVKFHEALSADSVYLRYFHALKLSQRVAHERLARICFIDYDREMALVAVSPSDPGGQPAIVGVGRLIKQHGLPEAEFAILVADACQGGGLGTELLRRLLQVGRDWRSRRMTADVLPENRGMLRVCEKLGFHLHRDVSEGVVKAVLEL